MKFLSILMVGVALLVGGCVQLQQPLVNGGSKLGANRVILMHEMENREGVCYAKGETEAFNGTAIHYRNDGSKESEWPYVGGKLHGTVIMYRQDGSKRMEGPYVEGKMHGMLIMYNKDGSKIQEIVFENDTKISLKQF